MALLRCDINSHQLEMCTVVNVIIPDDVENKSTPVVYLLHGLSDNCSNWLRLTSVERYANRHKVAIIIPEVQRSYYSDMKYGLKYFSYITKELVEFASSMFNLPTTRDKTFIAGLSMGGYGALKCGLTYPEQYAGIGAFSAVCDIDDSVKMKFASIKLNELSAIIGEDLVVPDDCNLYKLADKCSASPKILMTCGTSDILYPQNIKFKSHLEDIKMDITYQEWEGDHTWEFWDTSIEMALEFFFGKAVGGTKTPLCEK